MTSLCYFITTIGISSKKFNQIGGKKMKLELFQTNDTIFEQFDDCIMIKTMKITRKSVIRFVRFAFEQYAKKISFRQDWIPTIQDYRTMLREELEMSPYSFYFIAEYIPTGEILGTSRGAQWNRPDMFPCEKEPFFVSIPKLADEMQVDPNTFYHCSHITVDADLLSSLGYSRSTSMQLFQKLSLYSISLGMYSGGQLGIAELDKAVERYYLRKGVDWRPITPVRDYIGSTYVSYLDMRKNHISSKLEEVLYSVALPVSV